MRFDFFRRRAARSNRLARYRALACVLSLLVLAFQGEALGGTALRVELRANDIVYDPFSGMVYASVPSSSGRGNTITPINPYTGEMGTSVWVGNEPRKLAIADDGSYLYVGLDGDAAVRQVNLRTQTAELQFAVGVGAYGQQLVEDIEVMPGNPLTVAISRMRQGVTPRHDGVAIYDNGVMRPTTTPGGAGSNVIEFAGPDVLFGYNNEGVDFGFRAMTVTASGVAVSGKRAIISGFDRDIEYNAGRMYSTGGKVFDPTSGLLLGTFGVVGSVAPDAASDRAFILSGNVIKVFSQTTFQQLGQVAVPGASGATHDLIRFGADGLAFRTDDGQLYFVRDARLLPISVPEPSVVVLLGMGVLGLAIRALWRRMW